MREFAKSVVSYSLSSSLFGVQQMANFLTPQGWLKTDGVAKSFEKITSATKGELGQTARSTFNTGDDLQRESVDLMFDVFTLGLLDRGQQSSSSVASGKPAASTLSNLGGQALSFVCQGLEALGQTAGIFGQAMSGMTPGPGCGGCSSTETGWGPVRPPANG